MSFLLTLPLPPRFPGHPRVDLLLPGLGLGLGLVFSGLPQPCRCYCVCAL